LEQGEIANGFLDVFTQWIEIMRWERAKKLTMLSLMGEGVKQLVLRWKLFKNQSYAFRGI